MKLCEKLYELRRAAGLSQEELAEKLNVTRQAVSKWENGAAQPELSKLIELSRLYGVSVDELLSLEEAEKSEPKSDGPDMPAAQETPTPTQPRRVKLLRAAAAACLVLAVGVALYSSHRVKQLEGQVSSLQSQIMSVQSNLSSQIAGISNSVRDALDEESTLTAQFDYTIKNFDLDAYTCTLAFALRPKVVQDDLAVSLRIRSLESDDETTAVALVRDEYDIYRGEVVLALNNDGFEVTAAYDVGGERQLETLCVISDLADQCLPKLFENIAFGDSSSWTYRNAIQYVTKAWEKSGEDRVANLYLGAYGKESVKRAYLDYLVDGKSAAHGVLKVAKAREDGWIIADIPNNDYAYSIYGMERVELEIPYGAELKVKLYVELTDGKVLSALLTREVMRSVNNGTDDSTSTPVEAPIVLTET